MCAMEGNFTGGKGKTPPRRVLIAPKGIAPVPAGRERPAPPGPKAPPPHPEGKGPETQAPPAPRAEVPPDLREILQNQALLLRRLRERSEEQQKALFSLQAQTEALRGQTAALRRRSEALEAALRALEARLLR